MTTLSRSGLSDLTKSITDNLTTTVTSTGPFYAAVGASDLLAQKVREARTRAAGARQELAAANVSERAEKAAADLQAASLVALQRTLTAASKAAQSYEELAARGEKLVGRIRGQQATADLLAQAETAVAQTKGAVTTIRRAATSTERAARGTATTARHQGDAVSSTSSADVDTAVRKTRSSAKGTATTARKGAASAKRATRAATTSTRKTATSAGKATRKAAEKVGN